VSGCERHCQCKGLTVFHLFKSGSVPLMTVTVPGVLQVCMQHHTLQRSSTALLLLLLPLVQWCAQPWSPRQQQCLLKVPSCSCHVGQEDHNHRAAAAAAAAGVRQGCSR
jgi:hypothetical protein